MHIINILKNCGKIFFPSFCVNCGKECIGNDKNFHENWLCCTCEDLLAPFPHTICPACYGRTIDGRLENSCVQKTGLTRFFCACALKQKPLQALIYTYKYRHASTLHRHISDILLQWLTKNHVQEIFGTTANLIFVPIPLHEEKKRERGFNQAALIAHDIARAYNLPYSCSCLVRVKKTPSQLIVQTKEARENNMKNAFAVKNKEAIKGKRVVLVDDVYTTGATMKHAALALRESGAAEVWGIAVAKG